MKTRQRVAGLLSIAALSTSLTACGGGGGGGGSSVPASPATTAPTTAPVPAVAKSIARSDAQAALGASQATGSFTGGSTVLARTREALLHARAVRSGARSLAAASTCNASSITGTSYAYTQTTDASGNTIATYTSYYDAACTQKQVAEVLTIPANAAPTNLTITGIVTTYDRAGATVANGTVSVSDRVANGVETITFQVNAFSGAGTTPLGAVGITCTFTQGTAAASQCGTAIVASSGATPVGVTMQIGIATSGSTGGLSTATETIGALAYTGAPLAIAPGSGTSWSITGGTQVASVSGSLTERFNGSFIVGGTIALTDATNGAAVNGAFSATGGLSLTVSQNGTTLATVTVDPNGTGTIAYADGTSAPVTGWSIQG